MNRADKILVGIVVGALLLVASALAVALLRPKPTLGPEDTPQGVVYNYLLALQQGDYMRAHGYISPTIPGYPRTVQILEQSIQDNPYRFPLDNASIGLDVVSTRVVGDRAFVQVELSSFRRGSLFDSGQHIRTFEMELERDPTRNTWVLVNGEQYWAYCWSRDAGCP
jgi:hypothetical protein